METFSNNDLALVDRELGHFVQVQFDAVFSRAVFISQVEKPDTVLAQGGLFRAHVDDSADDSDAVLDWIPKVRELFTPQIFF